MMNNLITIKEVSKYLQIKERTIYSWINKGIIPHYKLTNKVVRFNMNEVNEWLSSKEVSV